MTIGKLSGQCDFGQKGQSYCNQRGQSCVAKRVKVAWLFQVLLDSKAFWICLIILLISLSIVMSGFRKRCRNCGKWWAMKIIRKRLVDEKASWIKKEFKDKTRDGRIIRTREEAVPATVYTYRIDRQCKHCGHEDYLIKEEKREN